jgi:hypothetical protein
VHMGSCSSVAAHHQKVLKVLKVLALAGLPGGVCLCAFVQGGISGVGRAAADRLPRG